MSSSLFWWFKKINRRCGATLYFQAFNFTSNATESLDEMLTESLKSKMPATSFQLFGVKQIEEDNMTACECRFLVLMLFFPLQPHYFSLHVIGAQTWSQHVAKQTVSDSLFALQIRETRNSPRSSTLLQSTALRSWPPFSSSVPELCRPTVWWTNTETTQTSWQRRAASLTSDGWWINLL